MAKTIFFTSINANYLPKAKLLAESVKQHHKDADFYLCFVEKEKIDIELSCFDKVVYPSEFIGNSHLQLIGQYSVVEACTAVKPFFFLWLLKKFPEANLIYLDPDIYVYSPLVEVLEKLKDESIIVTPHLTKPESTLDAIWDNEISVLRHGSYNLGFLAIKKDENSCRFIEWWANRLSRFSYVDYKNGIFTDQKWIDLAPSFFNVFILKHPGYNLAPWNTHHRSISKKDGNFYVEGDSLLRFVHFSGLDSGANAVMIEKYNSNNSLLPQLREEYVGKHGQQKAYPWSYNVKFTSKYLKRKFYQIQRIHQFDDPYKTIDLLKIFKFQAHTLLSVFK